MIKKLMMFVVAAMAAMAAMGAWSVTYTTEIDGSTWSYTLSIAPDMTTNATITAVTPADGVLVVPSKVDGYRVIVIGDTVGKNCDGITSLYIPDLVQTIGRGAFSNCGLLGDVTIGSGVTAINGSSSDQYESDIQNYGAFSFCSSLTNVTFGSSLKRIGGYSFYKCTSLANISIPNSVTTIGRHAFQGCTQMTTATFGNGLMSIDYYAFANCNGLKTVIFDDGGATGLMLGERVFSSCVNLMNLHLPDSLVSVGSNAFSGSPAYKAQ